jgi:predicted ATPase/Tfp pilus assembly protein PilF
MDPWREEAHRQLMLLLARSGQRSAALRQYETCRRILADELGVEPGAETRVLYERIRAAESARFNNLPPQLTPFVGREDVLAEIGNLLDHPACRLLTLVGPGGIGKTRLAIQAAAAKANTFLHSVCFVPLASVSSPDLLVPTIADRLKLTSYGAGDPKAQLLTCLREKEMLLVLDNFEHLLEGTGLIVELLKSAPEVQVLVTSQRRLNLQAEWLFEVAGMLYPASISSLASGEEWLKGYGAVELFVQSARRVRAQFAPSDAEKAAVVRICQLVDGMPLGIELAAAWVRNFACQAIAQQIEHNLDFLATTMPDMPERHKSLRAVFEYSWNLLSEEEKQVFGKLAVFRGGFWEEAAEQVAGASPVLLSALTEKFLLHRNRAGRYEWLEVLRQYAEQKLGEQPQEMDQARDLHCGYYSRFLHQREEPLKGARQKEALAEIREEIENVRAAWQTMVERLKADEMEQALESLFHFYNMQSWFQEGAEAFGSAVKSLQENEARTGQSQDSSILLGKMLARQGAFWVEFGQHAKAREVLQTSLSTFRHLDVRGELPFTLVQLGSIAYSRGEYAEAKHFHRESLTISKQIGDWIGTARALLYLATVAELAGEYAEAKRLLQESLAICREIGEQFLRARVLNNLGNVAFYLKEYSEAEQIYRESLALRTAISDQLGMGACLNNLGEVAYALGDRQRSRQYFQQALKVMAHTRTAGPILHILTWIATFLAQEGKKEQAVELLALVSHHPATPKDTRERAVRLLSDWQPQLSPLVVATALGKVGKLEEAVEEIVADAK